MAAIIQFRRDTAANWTSNNPTLAIGEIGYETDGDGNYKIGDGSTTWTSLGYGGLGDIHRTLIDAKGDLIVGTAADTAGRLAVGSNGQMLVADSSAAGGVSWASNDTIVNWHEAVDLATTSAIPAASSTYNNGTAGVGATLTHTPTTTPDDYARLQIDGTNVTTGDRVLLQDQVSAAHNGLYEVTAQGVSGTSAWVLTRADDFDGTPTGQIKQGESVYALAGTTNGGQGFVVTSTSDPHTVGTHDIVWTQFTGTQAFTAGTYLTITGNTVDHDDSGVSAGSYGSATQVPVLTTDAQGHLTTVSNTTIAIPSTAITDFTEAVQDVSGAQLATNGSHTGITATYDDAGDGAIDLALVTENVEDITGAQLATNGSHTGITATYDDAGDGAIDLALVTENVQDIVAGQLVTNGSHSGIAATYDDGGDGAIDLNVDDFTITLAGDLSGNATITNLADATLTATIVADATALGTDTTGDYVASLVAGTGVTLTNNSGETATPTIAIGQVVGTTDTPTFGSVTISNAVSNATHAATKAYVDNAIAGLDWHEAVKYASAAALPNTPTYNNGTSGVGATLTSATQVRLIIDGANATTGDRVLVQDQATGAHNGIYDVTAQGASGSAAWVLTRATDFDGAPTGEIKAGEAVYVLLGSANSGQGFVVTSTSDPHTVGSDTITWTQFTGTQAFNAGTYLTITGNTIDHDASGVSAAAYGSATQVPGYTVDAQGHLTAAANTTIAIPSTAVTDFTEAVQDVAGAQVATNGSHTGIAATYDDAGDGAVDLALTASGVSAASYGSATQVPGYTVDVYGRLTAASNTTIAIPSTAVTDFTEAVQDVSGAQLVTNGSHTHLTATYDDGGDGAIDIALNTTAVTAAAYGSATQVPGYTVDAYGRLTAAANTTIAIPSTAVTDFTEATQDVAGAQVATNGSHTGISASYDDGGDGAIDLTLTASGVSAASYGSATQVPGYTVDVYGRLTAASNTTIAIPSTAVTDFTEAAQDVSGAQLATNGSHTGITATYDDAGDGAIDLALVTENVQDITGAQLATNGSHTGITATYDDAGDGAVDLALITENVQDITGAQIATNGTHVGLTAAYDDAGDGAVDLTVAATLGTHTSGNYVATVAGTANEVNVSGSGSETAAVTIGLPDDVTIAGVLTVSGSIADGAIATTQAANDSTTKLATTAFVMTEIADYAPLASPTLTGVPAAPTAAADTNTTQIATTAYVQTELGALSSDSITDADGDTKVQVEESADEDIIRFDTAGTERMSIAADGTVTIVGNLTVNGTTTEISSTTITVDDKNIELGSVASPTDVTADGGGLTLKGTTDKTFNWVDSTDAWTSSEHLALATGKSVYIDSVLQLSKNALAATVVLADGVVGTTQSQSDGSTKVATTAYVDSGLHGGHNHSHLMDADNDTKIWAEKSADEDILRFDTAGTERMSIAADGTVTMTGDVSLGTTAAGETLNIAAVTTASGAGSALAVKGGNATGTNQNGSYVLIGAGLGTGSGVSGDIMFQTAPAGSSGTTQNTAASVMTITSAGDVHIPASNAQILGPASGSATAGAVSYSFSGDTDTGLFRSDANVFHAATAGATRMTWAADGKVGIGTSPEMLLHVYEGDSGATASAAHHVFLESDADMGVLIASGASSSGYLRFGDSGVAAQGGLHYNHVDDSMKIRTAGTDHLTISSAGNVDVAGNVIYNIALNAQTGSYTLVAADRGKMVTMNSGSALNCTVPPNSSVAFAIGTSIQVSQLGAGQVTMVAGSGVTLRYTPGLKLRTQYSSVTCIKISTDEWILVGDLDDD